MTLLTELTAVRRPLLRRSRGFVLENQEVRWGSEGLLRQGFELNPKSLELGVRLAKEISGKGKAGEAYELLESIREHHPKAPGPVIELARLAGMANNQTEARSRIAEARDLMDPKKHSSEAVDVAYLSLLLRDRGTAEDVLQSVEEYAYEPAAHLFLAVLTEESNPLERVAIWLSPGITGKGSARMPPSFSRRFGSLFDVSRAAPDCGSALPSLGPCAQARAETLERMSSISAGTSWGDLLAASRYHSGLSLASPLSSRLASSTSAMNPGDCSSR